MRIAQLLAPWLPVPPPGYGGIEVVVSDLTEELVRRGHEVTLFATGDAKTSAKLSFVFPKALGNDGNLKKNPFTILSQILPAFKRAGEFDLIHSHSLGQTMYLAELVKTPVLHTLHGTITQGDTSPEKYALYKEFSQQNYVSISNSQRLGLPELNFVKTVYNGINLEKFPLGLGKRNYLAWLGRITPKKGVVEAIKVSQAVGLPLKIAAFIDPVDQAFFETEVKPLLTKEIEFLGELDALGRAKFLSEALALLFPIKWQEPFGLVMVEAMACGTPVIAFNRGSVAEVVVNDQTGYVVEGSVPLDPGKIDTQGVERMATAVKKIMSLDSLNAQSLRKACRLHVETKFTIKAMVDGYEEVYQKLWKNQKLS